MSPEPKSYESRMFMGKYHQGNLFPALRLFIEARNKALDLGFTDNGGAIHSVERILDILSRRISYPSLGHINTLKKVPTAAISVAAYEARIRGEKLLIEHVLPQRAYARKIIDLVKDGKTNDELVEFIKANYRLVLLTKEETKKLNKHNRSQILDDRLGDAGIALQQLCHT
jgi:hypothetical protein